MIEAMMLFGSAARGDGDRNSDVDLLFVGSSVSTTSRKENSVEVQQISSDELYSMASQGDLFAIHLAIEGKVIFDSTGVFRSFKERLKILHEYSEIRQQASDLAWFLMEFGDEHDPSLVNKRSAWCARTTVISLLVEDGRFLFSPSALSEEFPSHGVPDLIRLRRSSRNSKKRKQVLKAFLDKHGSPRPQVDEEDEFLEHFERTNNKVAVSTVNRLKRMNKNGNRQSLPSIYLSFAK